MITLAVDLRLIDLAVGIHAPNVFGRSTIRKFAEQAIEETLAEEFRGFGPQDGSLPVAQRLPGSWIGGWVEAVVARAAFVERTARIDQFRREHFAAERIKPIWRREAALRVVALPRSHGLACSNDVSVYHTVGRIGEDGLTKSVIIRPSRDLAAATTCRGLPL
jgi:hypothetical protein